jgi:integrase
MSVEKELLTQIATLLARHTSEKGGTKEMPRKFKYGQGSVYKRSRNTKNRGLYEWYEVSWYDEYGRHFRATTSTLKRAYAILSQENPRSLKSKTRMRKTFGEYMREWYDTNRRADCGKERNQLNDNHMSRMPKEILDKPLGDVRPNEFQAYINSLEKPNTRSNTQQLITATLKHAFNSGLIKVNVGMLLKVENPEARRKEILPRELEDKFLSLFTVDYHQQYAIGLIYTGTRISEFMRLNENWETDIDYDRKIVKIRETKSLRQKDLKAGTTYVIREIPLLPQIEALKFPITKVHKQSVNKNFNKVLAKLAEEGIVIKITPHSMRHTFISRCNEMGINKSVIKSMVGHKTDKMMNHYTHNTTELVDREYEKLMKTTPMSTPLCTSNALKNAI